MSPSSSTTKAARAKASSRSRASTTVNSLTLCLPNTKISSEALFELCLACCILLFYGPPVPSAPPEPSLDDCIRGRDFELDLHVRDGLADVGVYPNASRALGLEADHRGFDVIRAWSSSLLKKTCYDGTTW